MAKLSRTSKRLWDLTTHRYEAFPATNPADIEACVQVLEEVRRKELNRLAGTSVLESHAFAGEKLDFTLMDLPGYKNPCHYRLYEYHPCFQCSICSH